MNTIKNIASVIIMMILMVILIMAYNHGDFNQKTTYNEASKPVSDLDKLATDITTYNKKQQEVAVLQEQVDAYNVELQKEHDFNHAIVECGHTSDNCDSLRSERDTYTLQRYEHYNELCSVDDQACKMRDFMSNSINFNKNI